MIIFWKSYFLHWQTAYLILIEKQALKSSKHEIHSLLKVERVNYPSLHLFCGKMSKDIVDVSYFFLEIILNREI